MDEILQAVYRADQDALSRLLTPESVKWTDGDGRTALMHAILADDANLAIVKLLLRAGVSVNAHDTAGQAWTALHFAARRQRADLVKALLDEGAEVDAIDAYGNTPLWRATMTCRDDLETIRVLLRAGADAHLDNNSGVSPTMLAQRAGKTELAKLLTTTD